MTISVTAYEFYGDPTGDSTSVSAFMSTIADLSLKGITNPTSSYYDTDIQRPPEKTPENVIAQTAQRYIAFRITGNYNTLKNVRIQLTAPQTYQKIGGIYTPITDNTKLMYKLTNVYQKPVITPNVFGVSNGAYDGTLNNVTGSISIHPRLSAVSPMLATSRQVAYPYASSYWTEFLVLQAQVYPNTCNVVGTFGKTGGTDIGSITGPLVQIFMDETAPVVID